MQKHGIAEVSLHSQPLPCQCFQFALLCVCICILFCPRCFTHLWFVAVGYPTSKFASPSTLSKELVLGKKELFLGMYALLFVHFLSSFGPWPCFCKHVQVWRLMHAGCKLEAWCMAGACSNTQPCMHQHMPSCNDNSTQTSRFVIAGGHTRLKQSLTQTVFVSTHFVRS